MEKPDIVTGDVVVSDTLANQILTDIYAIAEASSRIGAAVLAMKPVAPETPAEPAPETKAEPRVWDLSPEALDNYDAEQLVALRADHRADNHAADGCDVCAVLVRRLGSL